MPVYREWRTEALCGRCDRRGVAYRCPELSCAPKGLLCGECFMEHTLREHPTKETD